MLQKPKICPNSAALAQRTQYLPIYHPQRLTRILSAKEKWVMDMQAQKQEQEKENERKELEEMEKYR